MEDINKTGESFRGVNKKIVIPILIFFSVMGIWLLKNFG